MHLFENYLLSIYYVPIIVLSATHIVGNKSEKNVPLPLERTFIPMRRHIISKYVIISGHFYLKMLSKKSGGGPYAWPQKPYMGLEFYCGVQCEAIG